MVLSDYLPSQATLFAFSDTKWIAGSFLLLAFFVFNVVNSETSVNADIPFVGLHLGSISKRKAKYVSDANALLTEGYRVVCLFLHANDKYVRKTVTNNH